MSGSCILCVVVLLPCVFERMFRHYLRCCWQTTSFVVIHKVGLSVGFFLVSHSGHTERSFSFAVLFLECMWIWTLQTFTWPQIPLPLTRHPLLHWHPPCSPTERPWRPHRHVTYPSAQPWPFLDRDENRGRLCWEIALLNYLCAITSGSSLISISLLMYRVDFSRPSVDKQQCVCQNNC